MTNIKLYSFGNPRNISPKSIVKVPNTILGLSKSINQDNISFTSKEKKLSLKDLVAKLLLLTTLNNSAGALDIQRSPDDFADPNHHPVTVPCELSKGVLDKYLGQKKNLSSIVKKLEKQINLLSDPSFVVEKISIAQNKLTETNKAIISEFPDVKLDIRTKVTMARDALTDLPFLESKTQKDFYAQALNEIKQKLQTQQGLSPTELSKLKEQLNNYSNSDYVSLEIELYKSLVNSAKEAIHEILPSLNFEEAEKVQKLTKFLQKMSSLEKMTKIEYYTELRNNLKGLFTKINLHLLTLDANFPSLKFQCIES